MSSDMLRQYRDEISLYKDLINKMVHIQDTLYKMEQMLRDMQEQDAMERQEMTAISMQDDRNHWEQGK